MADWFYGKDNAQHGPVSDLEIRNLISTGQITQETIIWREGMTDWLPLQEVPDFQPAHGAGAVAGDATPYASPQAYPGQPGYGIAAVPTDGLSIASLICGILAIVSSCAYIGVIFGIPAVICGHMSLKKINNSHTPIGGKGMAIAGLVTGYLGSLFSICIIVFLVFVIATGSTV